MNEDVVEGFRHDYVLELDYEFPKESWDECSLSMIDLIKTTSIKLFFRMILFPVSII